MVEFCFLGIEGQFKGEEYYSVSGGLVYGFGFKVDFSYEWSLNLELNVCIFFIDYFDDVSIVYVDKDDIL